VQNKKCETVDGTDGKAHYGFVKLMVTLQQINICILLHLVGFLLTLYTMVSFELGFILDLVKAVRQY
jgi:hypothetical protein